METEEQQKTRPKRATQTSSTPSLNFEDQEVLPYTAPEAHYHMSSQAKHPIQLASWLHEHRDDAAFQVSYITDSGAWD